MIENYQEQVKIFTLLSIKIFEKFEQDSNLKFKDAFEIFNGGIFKSKDYATISKHKLITIRNVDEDGFNTTQTSYLSDQSIDRKYLLLIGDILLTMTGNIGRCGIVGEDNCCLNQKVLKVDCKSKLYLFCFLLKYKNDIVSLGRGTARKNLSINYLYLLDVNNSISEISIFGNYDYLFYKLVNLKLQIKKLIDLKKTLLIKYFN